MTLRQSLTLSGILIGLLTTATGCQEPALRAQVQSLQDQNEVLLTERDSLREQLNACLMDNQRRDDRILDLQMKYNEALDELEQARGGTGQDLPPGWQGAGGIAWTNVTDDILFSPGSATLKASGRAKLEEIARVIRERYAGREIWVIGHTDSDPIRVTKNKWQDNLDLSLNRSAAVFRQMEDMGFDPSQMVAAGQGEFNPVASNNDAAGKAKNRRVQILAVTKPETR